MLVSAVVLALVTAPGVPASAVAPDEPITLRDAIAEALEHANDMIQAREDRVLVDAEYLEALSPIIPTLRLDLSAGEFFAGQRIIESRNPVPAQLPTQFPQVNFGPFVDAQTNSYSNPQFSLGLVGRQLIYDGGRWWKAIDRVGDVRVARAAALAAVANRIRAQVARTFYELEKSRRAISTFRAQLTVDRAQIDRATALFKGGRGQKADVVTAERNLARDQITMRDFEIAEANARRAFNLQLGRDPRQLASLVLTATISSSAEAAENAIASSKLDNLVVLAKKQRPEFQDLLARIDAAKKDVAIAFGGHWPTLALEARYTRNSRRPDRLINNPFENYIATLDLALSWNLFDGRATTARVQRASVALRKLQAEHRELTRQIIADVEARFDEVSRQRDVLALAEVQVNAAEASVTLARGLFTAGRGTALELRDAELSLTQAKLISTNARLDIEIAKADLRRAVGQGPSLN